MGSNEQSDPIDETVLVPEAPKEAAEGSSAEECGSLVPLVSLLSTKTEAGCSEHSAPVDETLLVSEAPKEELESSSVEECHSLAVEIPASESGSGSLHEGEEALKESVNEQQFCLEIINPVGSEGTSTDGCIRTNQDSVADMCCKEETESKDVVAGLGGLESDLKDGCCPESDKLSEVERGVNRICLNEINLKNERIASDLEPVVSSLENVRFSGDDCSSNTSNKAQMASQEQSFFGAPMRVEEVGLCLPHNNDNPSVQRNMKSIMDLSDAVKGLHVDLCLSPRNGVPNRSSDWYEKMSSEHINDSLLGINLKNSELQHDVFSGQHFSTYVLDGSTLPSENVIGELASPAKQVDSLQSCASDGPDMVVGSGSPSDLARQEAFKLNGVLNGNDSVALADVSCFANGGGNAHAGDVQIMESNEALLSLRRSGRANKYIQKAPNRKYSRKGSKKALCGTIDLLPAAVRSKRSRLNRAARMSNWGLIESLSKYIGLSTMVADQGSGLVKSGKKSRKQGKVQIGAGSHSSKARNRASSGHVRLKLKLVNKDKGIIEPSPVLGTDVQLVPLTGNGDNPLDLSNNITEEGLRKSLERSSDIKLEKLATSQENCRVVVHPVDKDLEVTLTSDKCSMNGIIGDRNSSDKEAEKSGVTTDDRHLNSGTSPDSEVIQVPDSQFPSKVLEVHDNSEMDSSKATPTPAEDAIPAISKIRRKKGSKKEKLCQLGDSDVQNRLLSSSIIGKTEIAEKYCEDGTGNDMAAGLDVGHGPADLWNSKKLLPPAKSKGNRKSKGSKPKSKLKPIGAPGLDMDKSRRGKGDKWKLIGKYSISENGISDQAHQKEDKQEAAGKHGMDDSGNTANITSSAVTSEDVSSLPIIPGGVGQCVKQPQVAWVCCDDCHQWRCIPSNLADIINETNCTWTCKDNQDKAFADCSVPQEKSNAEINAELNISDDEEGHDVHLSGKYYSMKQTTGPQQSSWMLIKSNIFLHRSRKTQTLDEIMVCHCKPSRDGKLGCGDECLNRMLNIECVQGNCPCGDLCANQQFQRRSYANLKWFRCGKKGYGLQVLADVTQGQFLIEYVGEVLDLPAYEARQREYASKGHKHFYFMTLNGNEVIDACAKGNLGRFINHSCDPNCRTEKWMVNGEICIGIFAVRDIKKGEELTFDYNYVRVFGAAAKKCYCGSAQCRGYIGGDRLNTEVIVQGFSDEEFPEPVVVYENGETSDDYNIMPNNFLDVMQGKDEDILLQNDVEMVLDDKDMMNKLEEPVTSVEGSLPSFAEKDALQDSVVGSSQINISSEILGYVQSENVNEATLDVRQEKPINRISVCSVSPKRSDSLSQNRWHSGSLSESLDTGFDKSVTEMAGGKAVHSKARPRMKISCPSKSVKSKETGDSSVTIDKALVTYSKSQTTPNKLKRLVESSAKHRLETVEEKLNELLDNEGGICKRKDAFKGYLKLLVLTAASGDCSHHETIQSNKDLSMILDAILKTKSRTVLTDILNKNGLQMLHSMMKKCRGNFNMIPILRKLLKVFEFLAERNILTSEHINGEPPRPGMERFRDSVLSLTEHEDRKVHQIARKFRDRWIPRPGKKFNCLEKGDRSMDFNKAPSCSRLLGSHQHRCDQVERPSESMGCIRQSIPPSHLIDSDVMEGSPSHFNESVANMRGIRKRKSRWDQPSEAVSPHCIKEQKTELGSSLKFDSDLQPSRREEEVTSDDHLHSYTEEIHCYKGDDESQEIEEDAPPGFSCPSFGGPHLPNRASSPEVPIFQRYPGPLKCPSEIPLGYPQERYNSTLPIAYGIPFNAVQEFGTPQACTGDGWVNAPGMPFRPFPPLPPYPRERRKREVSPSAFNGLVLNGSAGKSQEGCLTATNNMDQGFPSSPSARLPNMIPIVNTHPQHDSGHRRLQRRYFKQSQNNFRKPSWGLDWKGCGSGQSYSRTPSGVVMGTVVNDHNEAPENVNYDVGFAGNTC